MRIVPIFFAKKMRNGQEVSECDHTNTCEKLRNKEQCDFKVATTLKNDEMLSPRIARTSVKLLNTTTTFDSRSMSASSASKCLWLKWTSTQDNISKNTTAQTRTYFARADSLEGEDTRGWSTRRTNRRWKEERRNTLFVVPTNPNRAQVLPLSQAVCLAIAWYKSNPAHGLSSKLTNILISLACQRTNYRCQWQSSAEFKSTISCTTGTGSLETTPEHNRQLPHTEKDTRRLQKHITDRVSRRTHRDVLVQSW